MRLELVLNMLSSLNKDIIIIIIIIIIIVNQKQYEQLVEDQSRVGEHSQ